MDKGSRDRGRRQRRRYKACKDCKITAISGALLSRRGFCTLCSERRLAEAVTAMHDKQGDIWRRWAFGMIDYAAGSVGGRAVLVFENDSAVTDTQSDAI